MEARLTVAMPFPDDVGEGIAGDLELEVAGVGVGDRVMTDEE
jgi:hypothetical protein